MDPHKILGIDESATRAEIESAYLKLVAKYHPESNSDADPWIYQQILDAYQSLSDDGTSPEKHGQQPPPLTANEFPTEPVAPVPVISTKNPRKAVRRKVKSDSNLPVWIGVLGGGISAVIVAVIALNMMGINPFQDNKARQAQNVNRPDNQSVQPQKKSPPFNTQDSRSKKRATGGDRRNPSTSSNDSLTTDDPQQFQPALDEALDDRRRDPKQTDPILPFPDNSAFDNQADEKSAEDESPPSDLAKQVTGEQPTTNPTKSDASEFWTKLTEHVSEFETIDKQPLDFQRTEAQREWMKNLRKSVDGRKHTFSFGIDNISEISRGKYRISFDGLNHTNGFEQSRRRRIRVMGPHNIKQAKFVVSKIHPASIVEIKGNVYVSGPDKKIDFDRQLQYMKLFSLFLDGNHEDLQLEFAIRKPTIKVQN